MKYSDIKYYIDLYKSGHYDNNIKCITLSKMLFCDIAEEVCDSYFEIYNEFTYDNFKFKLDEEFPYKKNHIVIETNYLRYHYNVLSENERIIKGLLE